MTLYCNIYYQENYNIYIISIIYTGSVISNYLSKIIILFEHKCNKEEINNCNIETDKVYTQAFRNIKDDAY